MYIVIQAVVNTLSLKCQLGKVPVAALRTDALAAQHNSLAGVNTVQQLWQMKHLHEPRVYAAAVLLNAVHAILLHHHRVLL